MGGADFIVTGDIRGLADALSPKRVAVAMGLLRKRVLKELAEEYIRRLRAAMAAGQAQGPALSRAWADQKGHSTPWVWREEILRSLTVVEMPNNSYLAGVPAGATSSDGKELNLIAMILEYGSYSTPARPIFEPVAQEMKRDSGWAEDVVPTVLRGMGFA